MKKYKKIIILVVIILATVIFIGKSNAVESDGYTSDITKMAVCTPGKYEGNYYVSCNVNNDDFGYRLTIIDSQTKKKVSNTYSVNYFSNKYGRTGEDRIYLVNGNERSTNYYIALSSINKYCGYKYNYNSNGKYVLPAKCSTSDFKLYRKISYELSASLHESESKLTNLEELIDDLRTTDLINKVFKDANVSISAFAQNKYEILVESLYLIQLGGPCTKTQVDNNNCALTYTLGTATEIAYYLRNNSSTYNTFGLGRTYPLNLAYNLCDTNLNSDCTTKTLIVRPGDNYTENISKAQKNLEYIYNKNGYGMVILRDIKGLIEVIKVETGTNSKLQGATFEIYKNGTPDGTKCKGGSKVSSGETDQTGSVIFNNLNDGTYCIQETTAPPGYKIANAQTVTINSNNRIHSVKFEDSVSSKKISVRKFEDSVSGRRMGGVEFYLCGPNSNDASKCKAGVTDPPGNTAGTIEFGSDYTAGMYYLYEKIPDGYSKDIADIGASGTNNVSVSKIASNKDGYDVMFKFEVKKSNSNVIIKIINKKLTCQNQCEVYKADGVLTLSERYELYNTFKSDTGENLNQLLNTKEPDCSLLCYHRSCEYKPSVDCLSGSITSTSTESEFSTGNYSCYTDTISESGVVKALCYTSFSIKREVDYPFKSIVGQRFWSNSLAATNTISKVCVSINSYNLPDTSESKLSSNASLYYNKDNNYSSSLSENDNVLEETKYSIVLTKDENNPNKYVGQEKYYFKKTYMDIFNNECSSSDLECEEFDGLFSNPGDEKANGVMQFKYSVSLENENKAYTMDTITQTASCNYQLTREFINNPKLNIEFRVIDTSAPFPGIAGYGRKVGKNWCGFDSNNNETCKNTDNSTITRAITNANNSYNSKGTGAIYKIKLTSSDIKKIRKYNSNTTYDDNITTCTGNEIKEEDKRSCSRKSAFVLGLINGTIENQGGSWVLSNKLNG